jgi:phage gp29-like protein
VFKHTGRRVHSVLRALGSLVPRGPRIRSDRPAVVQPWYEDGLRSYPSVGLTPGRLLAILQAADAGTPQAQYELFSEMLQKWPRLAAVEATRRLALTGLDWEITPAAASAPDAAATAVVAHCRDTLLALEGLRDALNHLASAIAHGIAVAELVWEGGHLVDIVPVPTERLRVDPREPWRLRVRTEDEPSLGVALDEYPNKWIVHCPRAVRGRPFGGGLCRASALLYLAQNTSFKDWLIYSQVAGMPVRVAQFEPGTPEADKQQLLKMLQALSTDAVAVFGKNVDLRFIEATRSNDRPYQPLQEYCNTEVTILWLGQHLTTDLRSSGSRAAAEIHDRVREDLLVDDIAEEGHTLRRDLLTPLVMGRFGAGATVPVFRRSLIQSVDTKVLADTLAVAVRDLGLDVPRAWVHRALGVPEPRDQEPVLTAGSGT